MTISRSKVALVTGANKGIGKAIVKSVARSVRGAPGWANPICRIPSSKTALNALTAHYARELASTPIKVNGAAPDHVATDFNNSKGTRTPDEGAAVAIRLAQLEANGPTGAVFENEQQLAW